VHGRTSRTSAQMFVDGVFSKGIKFAIGVRSNQDSHFIAVHIHLHSLARSVQERRALQQAAGARQPRHHRANGDVSDSGDFLV
jgi:hypothetical protein